MEPKCGIYMLDDDRSIFTEIRKLDFGVREGSGNLQKTIYIWNNFKGDSDISALTGLNISITPYEDFDDPENSAMSAQAVSEKWISAKESTSRTWRKIDSTTALPLSKDLSGAWNNGNLADTENYVEVDIRISIPADAKAVDDSGDMVYYGFNIVIKGKHV